MIAEKADGGMRDALSIFDQVASFSQGNVTFEKTIEDLNVLDADNYFKTVFLALDNKVADIMLLLNGVLAKGFDGGNFIVGLASHIRNVLMAKDPQTLPLLEVSDRQREQYREQAQKCPARFLYQALRIANRCDVQYRQSSNKRLLVELTLIEIAQITQPEDDAAGAGRSPKQLKTLFQKLLRQVQPERGAQVAPVAQRKRQHAQQTVQPTTDQSQSADQKADQRTESKPTQQSPETVRTAPPAGALKSAKLNLGRSMGMSFGDILTHKDKPTAEQAVEVENAEERNAFTEEDLLVQWRAMCTRMPENMRAMSTRMRNLSPVITDYPNVEIVAENQILYDQMLTIKSRIRATLAKCLRMAVCRSPSVWPSRRRSSRCSRPRRRSTNWSRRILLWAGWYNPSASIWPDVLLLPPLSCCPCPWRKDTAFFRRIILRFGKMPYLCTRFLSIGSVA